MTARTLARYATVAAIVVVVGGLFVYREYINPADDADLGMLASQGRPELDELAPDFELVLADSGEVVRLSDYRGQTVILNFWATWCVPCRREMPDLQAADIADDTVIVLAVNAQETATAVAGFVEEFELTFPVVLDRQGEVRAHYGAVGLPATFFIDPDGVLRARTFGPVFGDLLSDGIEAAR